jgi:magnesium transporter
MDRESTHDRNSKTPETEESSDPPVRESQVGELGHLLGTAFQLTRFREQRFTIPPPPRGGAAGIENAPEVAQKPEQGLVRVRCVDFDDQQVDTRMFDDVDSLLASKRPDWAKVRWIDVEGLHPYVVNRLREALGLHTLAAEDVWHVPQRPKAEMFGQHVFVIVQRFHLNDSGLQSEQVSAFATRDMLLTFQENQNDIWGALRGRIGIPNSRIQQSDATYLLYTVLDTLVDHDFPILEKYGERLEQIEEAVLTECTPALLREIHSVKRDLTVMRRVLWPMREAIGDLTKPDKIVGISDGARTYMRDVHDHCVQVMDILETFRELASNLTDLHISMTSQKMNEVVKVLTIMSTIFIPITFLAGVYGMNFSNLPELQWEHGYAAFWMLCGTVVGTLVWFFHKRGWLRGDD